MCTHLLINVRRMLSSLAEFPTPKTELVQKFQVLYVGMMPVARPIGTIHALALRNVYTEPEFICRYNEPTWFCFVFLSGMDILNGAVDSLMTSSARDDWIPVMLNVADATVTVIKEKAIIIT